MKSTYLRLTPFHDTWMLWLKKNKTTIEFFEVVIGTILVQNTSWKNVDKALARLSNRNIKSFDAILSLKKSELIELIKPAGFFNQKSNYLISISGLFTKNKREDISRRSLLSVKGIGEETADSILTYCLQKPSVIIGTYSRRYFAKLFGDKSYLSKKYEILQNIIDSEFNSSNNKSYELGHFHALIVAHSQNICTKKDPNCNNCVFKVQCRYNNDSNAKFEINSLINPKIKKNK